MAALGATATTRSIGTVSITTRTCITRRTSGVTNISAARIACTTGIRPRCEFRFTTAIGLAITRRHARITEVPTSSSTSSSRRPVEEDQTPTAAGRGEQCVIVRGDALRRAFEDEANRTAALDLQPAPRLRL